MMKYVKIVTSSMVMIGILVSIGFAQDSLKEVLMEAVDYGVTVLETKGKKGMEELESYRFADGEGYIYILTMDWIMLMHPAKELVNKDTTTTKGARGKFFGAEMKAKANEQGYGWTSYWWPNPKKDNAPELKCSYYKTANMDGQKVVVAAGLFGIPEDQCR